MQELKNSFIYAHTNVLVYKYFLNKYIAMQKSKQANNASCEAFVLFQYKNSVIIDCKQIVDLEDFSRI